VLFLVRGTVQLRYFGGGDNPPSETVEHRLVEASDEFGAERVFKNHFEDKSVPYYVSCQVFDVNAFPAIYS
jgi:hypothetical protein